jgi:hypothetical protein
MGGCVYVNEILVNFYHCKFYGNIALSSLENKGNDIYIASSTVIESYNTDDNSLVLTCSESNNPKFKSANGIDLSSLLIPCYMEDYFVSSTGSDEEFCSCNTPCRSISRAIITASSVAEYASVIVIGPLFYSLESVSIGDKIIDISGFYGSCEVYSYSLIKLRNNGLLKNDHNNVGIVYDSLSPNDLFELSNGRLQFFNLTLIHDSSSLGVFISISGRGYLFFDNVIITSSNGEACFSFVNSFGATG